MYKKYSLAIYSIPGVTFVVQPGDTIVRLNEMVNVIFECEVDEGTPLWSLQIPTYLPNSDIPQFLSTEEGHAERDREILNGRGITFFSTEGFTNISIPGVTENNCTTLYCAVSIGVSLDFSEEVKLTVVGKSANLMKMHM